MGLTTADREELTRLRKEVRILTALRRACYGVQGPRATLASAAILGMSNLQVAESTVRAQSDSESRYQGDARCWKLRFRSGNVRIVWFRGRLTLTPQRDSPFARSGRPLKDHHPPLMDSSFGSRLATPWFDEREAGAPERELPTGSAPFDSSLRNESFKVGSTPPSGFYTAVRGCVRRTAACYSAQNMLVGQRFTLRYCASRSRRYAENRRCTRLS